MKQQEKQAGVSVFYSYAHEDEPLREQLEKHLSMLRRQGLISEWHDRQIAPGTEWAKETDAHLEAASVVLLLVSPDFLASDYCYGIEMQRALERHTRGETRVIPVILRPCEWYKAPFAHLQVLPNDGKSVTEWNNLDAAFLDITQGIRKAFEQQTPSVRPRLSFSQIDRQNRARLLKRVRATWIEGLLEQSLHRDAWIDLHLQEQPDALENPWRLQVQELNREPHPLPIGTSIAEVYDQADGELLILGEPGSGKTMQLLQLTKTLLDRAEADKHLPMPVIFHLSSWAHHQLPLDQWLVTELQEKYHVLPSIGRPWVEHHQLSLLLDGLDEVAAEARVACIQTITTYHQNQRHQTTSSLVLCCRSQEYQELAFHLPLNQAISILPLTNQQVDTYLSLIGKQADGLHSLLTTEPEFAVHVHTPLMLGIATLAFQGKRMVNFPSLDNFPSPDNFPTSPSREQLYQIVFDAYVEKMLNRRRKLQRWKPEQFLHWLHFLAKHLHQQQQTVFSVEDLQPDWLENSQQHVYRWSLFLVFVLVLGVAVGGLIGGLVQVLVGLVFGLVCVLVGVLVVERGKRIRPAEVLIWSWKKALNGFIAGVVGGLVVGIVGGLAFGLVGELIFGLIGGLIGGRGGRIWSAEGITWSWRKARNGLLVGLVAGLVGLLIGRLTFELTGSLVFTLVGVSVGELAYGLLGALTFGLLGALLTGLSGDQLPERIRFSPNEAIQRSGKNGLLGALTIGPLVGLLAGLFVALFAGPLLGLIYGLVFGSLTGLVFGSLTGLDTFVQHYTLRIVLWRTNYLPWNVIAFLDEATERLFLRKVGGSYVFVHRLLLEYFAALDEPAPTTGTLPKGKG